MDFQLNKKDIPRQTSDSQIEICKCTVCVSNRMFFFVLFFYKNGAFFLSKIVLKTCTM